MSSTRELTRGQAVVLGAAAAVMVAVGVAGGIGTYSNAVSEFHRRATAGGVVAAGEGLTVILGMVMLGRTMLGMASPGIVRAGMWLAPVSAACIGVTIASDAREAVVYAVTPLAMSGAAEGLSFIARSIVVYRTGVDAETLRRNADAARQLAYHRAVADGHPGKWKQKVAVRRYWRLAKHVGVGDTELGAGLVDVQRVRVRDGADAALGRMYGQPLPAADQTPAPARPVSATEVLRERFAEMDPADAIRLAHDARPDAPPAELAHLLGAYGVAVDAVAVALVLGQRPAEYEVHRPDAPAHQQVNALEPVNLQGAVEEAASVLGPDASPRQIAEHIAHHRRLLVDEPYVRTALSRAAKKPQPQRPPHPRLPGDDQIGKGGQGYN
ncbi:conjugal transfer protein [Streptomyces sp. NPDC057382]|uniref:conjugal transfer protein n=1 Tax=unclassified Streptomyces TaxID=2593676 RepID=UPI003631DD3C